jgi:hypothetical protein
MASMKKPNRNPFRILLKTKQPLQFEVAVFISEKGNTI